MVKTLTLEITQRIEERALLAACLVVMTKVDALMKYLLDLVLVLQPT